MYTSLKHAANQALKHVVLRSVIGGGLVILGLGASDRCPAQQAGSPAPVERHDQALPPPPRDQGAHQVGRGPDAIVEIPGTPMLDEEGRQRLDPDGKPMFNPPVRQQRDKKGHPMFDEKGRPVMQTPDDMGFDDRGKKIKGLKDKDKKSEKVEIVNGILTLDGLPAKAALNYSIDDFRYVYFYAPFVGTAIVSDVPFPGAIAQKNAFDDKTLTVSVGEHVFQLSSDERLLSKKGEPAYVLVDRDFRLGTRNPAIGYGTTDKAPYSWPNVRTPASAKGSAGAPPLPANLRPEQVLLPCPEGQMRAAKQSGKPGNAGQACVPIPVSPSKP